MKKLGVDADIDGELKLLLGSAHQEGFNARQLADEIKKGFNKGVNPKFAEEVEGEIPEEPNAYPDSGLHNPRSKQWNLWGVLYGCRLPVETVMRSQKWVLNMSMESTIRMESDCGTSSRNNG